MELDQDGNGILTKEELIDGYYKITKNRKQAEKKAVEVMKLVDVNENGDIDFSGNPFFLGGLITQSL